MVEREAGWGWGMSILDATVRSVSDTMAGTLENVLSRLRSQQFPAERWAGQTSLVVAREAPEKVDALLEDLALAEYIAVPATRILSNGVCSRCSRAIYPRRLAAVPETELCAPCDSAWLGPHGRWRLDF